MSTPYGPRASHQLSYAPSQRTPHQVNPAPPQRAPHPQPPLPPHAPSGPPPPPYPPSGPYPARGRRHVSRGPFDPALSPLDPAGSRFQPAANRRGADQRGRSRVRVIAQALAVLVLVGGVAGYFGGTSEVKLVDDGTSRTIRTYASTVRGLLHHAGITLAEHDKIRPAPRAAITAGSRVVVKRGRPLALTLDGETSKRWVTARTVNKLISHLKLGDVKLRVSASRRTVIPREGMRLTIRTKKRLALIADGDKAKVTTYAATPAELLKERDLALKGRDEVKPKLRHTLAGVEKVRVIRVTVKSKTETVELDPPVKVEKNPDWMVDQKQTVDPGRTGKAKQRVEHIYRDGKYSERKVISSKTLVEPKPAVVRKGTKKYPEDDTGLNWDALAQCESGDNPRSVSGNGMYHGLYQFNVQMWQRMGGIGLPSEATSREQTYRAILLYKAAGADQWPHCGPRLFS